MWKYYADLSPEQKTAFNRKRHLRRIAKMATDPEYKKRQAQKRHEQFKRYYKRFRKKILAKAAAQRKAHPEKAKQHGRKNLLRNMRFVAEYLSAHPCVDCAQTNIDILEFDHVRGKKTAGVMQLKYGTLQRLQEEVSKCEVRCCSCHRLATLRRAKVSRVSSYLYTE